MIIRIVLLALIGCGLAGFGVIVWTISPRADAPVAVAAPPPAPKVKLMVVVRSVRAGALLKTEDFGARDVDSWPRCCVRVSAPSRWPWMR
jgi:Flp pilus assembly protein CpaB